jgi:endonuclease YncB( thermonuclease family)
MNTQTSSNSYFYSATPFQAEVDAKGKKLGFWNQSKPVMPSGF